jgi:peroxiredoxin Q/BCP
LLKFTPELLDPLATRDFIVSHLAVLGLPTFPVSVNLVLMLDWLFSEPLVVGSSAPDFSLADDSGRKVRLSKLRGKNVVLVFYPLDDTPGCTKQLCQFRDEWKDARTRGVKVFGVNPQSARSHKGFREKCHLPFPLLVDEGHDVAKLYHADGLIVKRTVYLIGPDGTIRFAQRGMPAPEEVLARISA